MRLILAGGLDPDNVADAVAGRRAVGRRRVDRRRALAGQKDAAQGQALHRAGPRRGPGAVPRRPTSCRTTGPTSDATSDVDAD